MNEHAWRQGHSSFTATGSLLHWQLGGILGILGILSTFLTRFIAHITSNPDYVSVDCGDSRGVGSRAELARLLDWIRRQQKITARTSMINTPD